MSSHRLRPSTLPIAAVLCLIGLVAQANTQQPSTPSGLRTLPALTLPPAPAGVPVLPGEDINAKVAAAPAGTTFLIKAGVHRLQSIAPKDGDAFIGEPGTILSGAKVLTGWVAAGGRWYVSGQTQANYQGYAGLGICTNGEGCAYPEDLFVNSTLKRHVRTLGEVGPGTWFFDYAADRIYVGDNPAGQVVETSVTDDAFHGAATNVTIQDLTLEKYASPPQHGLIHGDQATGWLVQGNEIRYGHAVGVRIHAGMRLVGNLIHHQGQMGVGGGGLNPLIERNEISYNNTIAYSVGWEAGGTKFVATTGLRVLRNYVHDNLGVGLWTDINNRGCLYDGNTVDDNLWAGLMHEISLNCTITNNLFRRNGLKHPNATTPNGACWYAIAAIFIAASPNVEVANNRLIDNAKDICALQQNRGDNEALFGVPPGTYRLRGLNVHDNDIASIGGATGLSADAFAGEVWDLTGTYARAEDPLEWRQPAGTGMNNRFRNNRFYYSAGSPTAAYVFQWAGSARNWNEWRTYGHDAVGALAARAAYTRID